jgi:alpha-galactosidase
VIAVDQDRLGVQGQVLANHDGIMVLSKPLADGGRAIALYNGNDQLTTISTTAAMAGLPQARAYRVRDLWSGRSAESAGEISAAVPAHGTMLYRVSTLRDDGSQLVPMTTMAASLTSSVPGAPGAAPVVLPGGPAALTTTLSDQGRATLRDVRVTGAAPAGWQLVATDSAAQPALGTGSALTTHWSVTAPADASPGLYSVTMTGSFRWGAGSRAATDQTTLSVLVPPAPPTGAVPLSSLSWVSASNGWGPVEKDTSNGEQAAGDGHPITIGGRVYARGLGAHAPGEIVYYLGGRCSGLTVDVGIDDEKTANGSAIFEVFADGALRADSGAVGVDDPAKTLSAGLSGATWLRLVTDPNGSTDSDHTDWAGPILTCS